LSEVRISDKGSEVSNGGSTDIPIEFLAKIFSQERAPKILEKIRRTTINLTMLLNKKYDNAINELAFDILIDKAENIYIAEINTKPGLAGVERYEDFFNMNDYEKNFYGNLSIKHGHYLARSLIYRDSLDG
jgi:hypothetical protein